MRDPTEFRARHKAHVAARAAWDQGIIDMMSGVPGARERMPELTKAVTETLERFQEESKYFVFGGPKFRG